MPELVLYGIRLLAKQFLGTVLGLCSQWRTLGEGEQLQHPRREGVARPQLQAGHHGLAGHPVAPEGRGGRLVEPRLPGLREAAEGRAGLGPGQAEFSTLSVED